MTEPLTVSVAEFRAHLADYLHQATEGRLIYIASRNYKIAALVPVADARQIESKR